ncbi:hypothetical protein WJX72_009252 [[Myrmecia] bisecta]|uniref:Uncharacterized protein n=1 Tax=[Myrmecia] bisecta TaxID=41462 RepID=A0AAW1QG11_9CHLO
MSRGSPLAVETWLGSRRLSTNHLRASATDRAASTHQRRNRGRVAFPNVAAALIYIINYIRANGGADFNLFGANFNFGSGNILRNCESGIAAAMGWTAPVVGQPNIAAAAIKEKVGKHGTTGYTSFLFGR